MSHEIRTPMNAVLGMTHLARVAAADARQRNHLDKIDAAARALLRIVDDILDFSKIEAGKLSIEKTTFLLGDVLDNLADMLGAKAQGKGLELLFRVEPELAAEVVIGDPFRLGQILVNLVGNAIKFTAEGDIVVGVRRVAEDNDHLTLSFAVRDTGIGLDPEQRKRLFQPFEQADSSITRKFGGTGLGLAICKRLVELMGGELSVASELGRGSEFSFTVRLEKSVAAPKPLRQPEPNLEGKRILVVDDNETARDVLTDLLESLRFQVHTANDGKLAVAEVRGAERRGEAYDAVLLDWKMPGLDGIETARAIRADASLTRQPKLIMVTAHGQEGLQDEARAVALDGFLLKPVNPSTLFDMLMDAFSDQPTGQPRRRDRPLPASTALTGVRILLVEDNEVNQDVESEILRQAGMTVDIAENGEVALARLAEQHYDAVLMDVQMPVMDGFEATRRLRRDDRLATLPVIAMTASVLAEDKEHCRQAGMNDFIAKPIIVDELLATLSRWVSGMKAAAPEDGRADAVPEELTRIDGFDAAGGLRRVGGDGRAYLRLLAKFRRYHAGDHAAITAAWRRGDREESRKLLHTLKGVSGNVGAQTVFETARDIQADLDEGVTDGVEAGLARLGQQLDALFAALDATLQEETGNPPAGQPGQAFSLYWERLGRLVGENDTDAIEALRQARAASPDAGDPAWNELERLLERHDYETAAARLAQWTERTTKRDSGDSQ
ncbi:MAG TPA: response regulator, partial [Parasulfuritortus sp.]